MVAAQGWRVGAISGVGACEPALPRFLRHDLFLLLLLRDVVFGADFVDHRRCTRTQSPKPPRPPPPTPHGRRRRCCCCSCYCCCAAALVLRLGLRSPAFNSEYNVKKLAVCRCGDYRHDRARLSRCAATHLARLSPPRPQPQPPPQPPPWLLLLRQGGCCCAAAAAAVGLFV